MSRKSDFIGSTNGLSMRFVRGGNEINILYGWIMNNCNTCINSRPIIAPTSIIDIAVRKWMGNIIKQRF